MLAFHNRGCRPLGRATERLAGPKLLQGLAVADLANLTNQFLRIHISIAEHASPFTYVHATCSIQSATVARSAITSNCKLFELTDRHLQLSKVSRDVPPWLIKGSLRILLACRTLLPFFLVRDTYGQASGARREPPLEAKMTTPLIRMASRRERTNPGHDTGPNLRRFELNSLHQSF